MTSNPGYPPQPPIHDFHVTVARIYLGEPAASVVSALSSYGKLTIKDIGSKTSMNQKQSKLAVVVLCQLNCVYFWKEKKDIVYQLNPDGLFLMAHAGDIINHIKSVHGEKAAEIIQNVLANGSVRISDYCGGDNIQDETEFFKLFSEKWLVRLQPRDHRPLTEVWTEIFNEVLQSTPRSLSISEVKRVAEAKEKAKVKFLEYQEQGLAPKDLYNTHDGVKRLQPDLVVKVSWLRFLKHLRTVAIVNLAMLRVGSLLALVLQLGLEHIELGSTHPGVCHPFLEIPGLINDPEEERLFINLVENKLVEDRKIVFAVHDVVRQLPHHVDLSNSITTRAKRAAEEAAQGAAAKRVKLENGDSMAGYDDEEPQPSQPQEEELSISDIVQQHLQLLANGTLVLFLTETSPGNYLVPFNALMKSLKDHYFEIIVKATFGDHAFRVLRCLKQQRIGDEKSIANAVLLREKSVRNEINKLNQMNMVEIQEVPKLADRSAARTHFLFRHNQRHAAAFLQGSLAFDMVKILENIESFKEDHKILLAKCEREDVKGKEEELLMELELKTLRLLQNRETDNMARFNRVKNLYNVMSL